MDDTISRAAVVDEIEGVDWYHINRNGEMVHGANDAEHQAWYKADDIYAAIERVPFAQPVAKDTNVPVKDCISRQAALDAVINLWADKPFGNPALVEIKDCIEALPSAQRWIPVAKGLPGKYEYVLLTCERNGKIAVDFGCISPDIDGHPSWWIAAHDLIEGWRVFAWCPLPEPWKGEEHGTSRTVLSQKPVR